ncbi:hypothetical protein, partial [Hornefia butyriciproducens]|uniref:hypothetical protein n=1 Tax=Hornefia butyriciproducens TaxID=2652293 RepID=UPI002A90DAE9
SFCRAMNPYWLIEFYSISGLIPIPDFMKPASAGRFSLKCGSYLFIQAAHNAPGIFCPSCIAVCRCTGIL